MSNNFGFPLFSNFAPKGVPEESFGGALSLGGVLNDILGEIVDAIREAANEDADFEGADRGENSDQPEDELFEDSEHIDLAVDVEHVDGTYIIQTDLPGIPTENVTVEVEDDTVIITAVRHSRCEWTEFVVKERPCSAHYYVEVPLDELIDAQNVQSSLINGVLTVNVPVIESPGPVTVKITTR